MIKGLDMGNGDDKGAVYPAEFLRRKRGFDLLERSGDEV
jgi:hypothetical protein